jgi:hypothetical protein
MTSISFGLACLGFILLSLSLKRHYLKVWPQSENFQRWYLTNRLTGYGLVALSALPCFKLYGFWIGLVLWISLWAAAAFMQAILLTYWPKRSLLLGGASIALVVLGLLS